MRGDGGDNSGISKLLELTRTTPKLHDYFKCIRTFLKNILELTADIRNPLDKLPPFKTYSNNQTYILYFLQNKLDDKLAMPPSSQTSVQFKKAATESKKKKPKQTRSSVVIKSTEGAADDERKKR